MKKIKILSIFFIAFILNFNQITQAKAKEKNCFYCKDYKYLKDWPEEKRPKAFI